MSTQHDPKGLGKVLVANAGTPVPIKAAAFMVKACTIQADPANVGTYMYVKDAAGNLMAKLGKASGTIYSPPITLGGVFDLSQLQLDSDTNNDGAYVAYC